MDRAIRVVGGDDDVDHEAIPILTFCPNDFSFERTSCKFSSLFDYYHMLFVVDYVI